MTKNKQATKKRNFFDTNAFSSTTQTQNFQINVFSSLEDFQVMQINNEKNDDVEKISRDDISNDTTRIVVAETSMNDEKEKMIEELKVIKIEKRRVLLREELKQARTKKIVDFRIASASTIHRITDVLQREKLFKIVDLKKYKKINQHDLNIFIRECNDEFEIKFYIYAENKNRILFVQRYLSDTSTND
jgi:hypothetical protein